MSILVDSYSESNRDASSALYSAQPDVGQTFTGAAGTLELGTFFLQKTGTPAGNITAVIYAHTGTYGNGGHPTGDPLATSDNVDAGTVGSGTNFVACGFNFSGTNQYVMSAATNYAMVAHFAGGDASNRFEIGQDSSSSTHPGNLCTLTAGFAGDLAFYVYRTGVVEESTGINGYKSLLGVGR